MSIINLLQRVHLFANLTQDELSQLSNICSEKAVGPHELIIEQNTTGKEMYIVGEGSVEVYIQGPETDHTLVVLGKGQVIGEMALIDQGYRSASVRTKKGEATLYLIEHDDFYRLCNENHHIGFVVMRNLAIDVAFKLRHRNLAEL